MKKKWGDKKKKKLSSLVKYGEMLFEGGLQKLSAFLTLPPDPPYHPSIFRTSPISHRQLKHSKTTLGLPSLLTLVFNRGFTISEF